MQPTFVDMQTSFARYFYFRKIDMFFVSLKTRYDINLVAIATYRVACNISSLLRHIENLARDLYRCIALQCNSSCQDRDKNALISLDSETDVVCQENSLSFRQLLMCTFFS